MASVAKELLEEYSYYYQIHSQSVTREEMEQKEKGINRMKSMAATYFNGDKDYMDHLEGEKESYQKIKHSIAAAFISDIVPRNDLYRRGFGPSTLKDYCIEFKQFAEDIMFIESRSNRI